MMNSEIKTLEGNFISQHEIYYCIGIEFINTLPVFIKYFI